MSGVVGVPVGDGGVGSELVEHPVVPDRDGSEIEVVDLLFVGKFAKQEAAGHGIREEIGAALIADIPTLVVLREGQLDAWRAFAGDDWQRLAPEPEPILTWATRVTGRAG